MPLQVFDYRRDIKNVVITPEIRARFLRFEVGDVATRHSHDLGGEVFLILQGRAEFEIDGETAVLGPGELCFAGRDELAPGAGRGRRAGHHVSLGDAARRADAHDVCAGRVPPAAQVRACHE